MPSERHSYHVSGDQDRAAANLRRWLRMFGVEPDDDARRLEHEARQLQYAADEIKAQDHDPPPAIDDPDDYDYDYWSYWDYQGSLNRDIDDDE